MLLRLTTIDRRLFIRKLTILFVGTVLFIPLVYFKYHGLAMVYIGALLALHCFIFYVYFMRTPWRRLLEDKAGFAIRIVAIIFFIYLLTLIRYEGSLATIIINTSLALVIHVGILAGLMVIREAPKGSPSSHEENN
ncbi:hypothetical protein JNJ66_03705 [Candidatus Saccharibacteria bacterium]|nr:hypothetical protein [Candidatus Saccharibacteria bacterium]